MALPLTHSLMLRKSLKIIILITDVEYIHVPDTIHFLIYKMKAWLKDFGLQGFFFPNRYSLAYFSYIYQLIFFQILMQLYWTKLNTFLVGKSVIIQEDDHQLLIPWLMFKIQRHHLYHSLSRNFGTLNLLILYYEIA